MCPKKTPDMLDEWCIGVVGHSMLKVWLKMHAQQANIKILPISRKIMSRYEILA